MKKNLKKKTKEVKGKKDNLVYTTGYSQLVTHPIPNPTHQGLISCNLRQV